MRVALVPQSLAVLLLLTVLAAPAQSFSDIRPTPQQVAWQDLEVGVLIHFGPNTVNIAPQAVPTVDGPAKPSKAVDGDPDTFWTAPTDARSATATLTFKTPATFDRAVTMELLTSGQMVHKYDVQVAEGKGWRTLAAGTAWDTRRSTYSRASRQVPPASASWRRQGS